MIHKITDIIRWKFKKREVAHGLISCLSEMKNLNTIDKCALLIYVPWAIKAWKNKVYNDENFISHSMHWESIEMVKLLNFKGFNVDVADCTSGLPYINWSKYSIVIDERNSIYNSPIIVGQKKIFYATGIQWLAHNIGELQRLQFFKNRYGNYLPAERQVEPTLAEATSDCVTYFGGNYQKLLFTNPAKTFPLFLSSTYIPDFKEKNIKASRYDIIWLGSRGFIHKGLDIVMEAFKMQSNFKLHICTDLKIEPLFYEWYLKEFGDCSQIVYHGWKNVNDEYFRQLIENCIASIYCSVAEGGGGAIIQAMQFGCIPIVNDSTALRAENLGFSLNGSTPSELVESILNVLKIITDISDNELKEQSTCVREYANKNHSKEAFSKSFNKFLNFIMDEPY